MISAVCRLKLPAVALAILFFTGSTVLAGPLTVVSLNLARENSADRILEEIRGVRAIRNADVFLLQEVVRDDDSTLSVSEELAARMGYYSVFAPAFTLGPGVTEGIAIVSRFPLSGTETLPLKSCDVLFRTRSRIALGSTVVTPSGNIRVFNAH
ncbi:MAG: endonuclease/exonuclease/phosphatase family protein, partial [Bryobacteraceae bacterium]